MINIDEVRQRHEGELLAIDGVEGVGVGEQDGQPAIKLYIDSSALSQKLPEMLESVPIVVEDTGQFEAHA